MKLVEQWRQTSHQLKRDSFALYLAYRHPETPWTAKLFAGLVAAYAFSPIDLIPDFIPVLGYLDDLVLVPAGIAMAVRMIPSGVMRECRNTAERQTEKPVSFGAGLVIVLVWVGLAGLSIRWTLNLIH